MMAIRMDERPMRIEGVTRRPVTGMARAGCLLMAALLSGMAGAAELRGHGGPVRAIGVTAGGEAAITGSFDNRAIVWSLGTGEAREVLLFHGSEVNAVAALPDGRFATAGADGKIAIWAAGAAQPVQVLEGHEGPVTALAVSPDGATLASASWDTTVRLWPLSGGETRVLEGHEGNVNAVAFLADGTPVSAGYDARLIVWPARDQAAPPLRITLPAPLNALAALPGDRIVVGGADGRLRVVDRKGAVLAEAQATPDPVIALAASPDGKLLAASGIGGTVALFGAERLEETLRLKQSGPVWALAFTPHGRTLLTGSADRLVREWDVDSGEALGGTGSGPADPLAAFAGDPGAEAFRACVACHTLDPEEGERAGPTLHGIFGRRIASVPGYRYSPALSGMDIVWTPETVSELFEVGPAAYTPGTIMPEQKIRSAETRAALMRFLEKTTGPE